MLLEFFNLKVGYIATVLITMSLLTFIGMGILRRVENKRLRMIKKKDLSEAVETDTPEEDSEKIARHRAVESVENRFTFMRRLFIPTMTLFTLFIVVFPFLNFIPAAYISLFAGVFAVLAGIASRPLIENLFAGLVITFNQPIRVGDTVIIQGRYGTVEDINILNTVIKVWNWRRLIVPNSRLLQIEFENLSLHTESEWAHISFWVEPGANIEKVRTLAKEAMLESRALLDVEEPSFWVMNIEKDAIECWVAGWAESPAQAWALKASTRRLLVNRLNRENINYQLSRSHISYRQDQRPPLATPES